MSGLRARAGTVAAAAGLLCLGCSADEDLAALIVGSRGDGGIVDAGGPFDVIGTPWRGARPQLIAVWPVATPLREFFAGTPEPGGRRVTVPQPDREALRSLRASVAAGDYGGSRTSVVAEDQLGDEYLIVFFADDA